MKRHAVYPAMLVGIALTFASISCGKAGAAPDAKQVRDTEWNVCVCKAVPFSDTTTGIDSDTTYTVADTAAVNQKLRGVKPENLSLGWTIPGADAKIWLVAYESQPILSGTVTVTEAYSIHAYGGIIQVTFRFADAGKWATITKENIGKRLAVFVNGQLMNAPQVNMEISSGNCSVTIPADKIHDYLPDFDVDALKQ